MTHSSDRGAWLAARRELVTASDVAALLGESPYKTREQLRMEKAGLAEEWAGDEQTELALALEPYVMAMARERWGWKICPVGRLFNDASEPRLGATPDGSMDTPWGDANVQIKVTSAKPTEMCKPRKDGSPSTAAFAAGAPLHYQLQVQAEMAVMGVAHSSLLVLHTGPLALRAYYVPRHDGVIARIRREVVVFWSEVEALRRGEMVA